MTRGVLIFYVSLVTLGMLSGCAPKFRPHYPHGLSLYGEEATGPQYPGPREKEKREK